MGCRYCYATYTHEFMGIDTPEDFHSVVYVKTGAEAETARRLVPVVRKGGRIALGTATDPYQPAEAEARVTRRFLETVAAFRNVRLGITTKGALVLRDLDLLRRIHERSQLSVHVSLISLDAELLRRVEPWAPPPDARLAVMRRLAEAGIHVSLAIAPILPALTDDEAGLDALCAAAAAAGVRRSFCNVLFLRSPTREKYLRWIAREFPRYLEAYQDAYEDRVYIGGRYHERLLGLMSRLRRKHGLTSGHGTGEMTRRRATPAQLPLWT
jgi:DNA repair photolyase